MKRFVIAAVLIIGSILVSMKIGEFREAFSQGVVRFTIHDAQTSLALYIDNQFAGTLPLGEQTLSPGVHTFALRNVKGDEQRVWWQGELEVNKDDALVMTLFPDSSKKKLQGVVLTRFFSNNSDQSRSVVFSSDGADIYINAQKYTESPVLIEPSQHEEITIRTEHTLLPNIQYSFDTQENTFFATHIYLLYDYLSNIAVQDLRVDTVPTDNVEIFRRWEWQQEEQPLHVDNLRESAWDRLQVYSLIVPEFTSTQKTLRTLEEYFGQVASTPRIPFCFTVDPVGDIWEGFGVWNYDFSLLEPLDGQAGACPVLVLLTEQSQQLPLSALNHLAWSVGRQAPVAAEILTSLQQVTLTNQERKTVEVEVLNNGWRTWHTQEGTGLTVKTSPTGQSDLVDTDNWIDMSTVTRSTDPVVIPGGRTILQMPIRGSIYPITYTEEFSLFLDDEQIPSSIIRIPVQVQGIGEAVQVQNTQTGFLNVYETPSNDSTLLISIYPNERYARLEQQGGWSKIRLQDGRDGWVESSALVSL